MARARCACSCRDALPVDLDEGGCAVEPVARAIAWLARHGLLYTDLREPNVRILDAASAGAGGAGAVRVTLVDYDDCGLVDVPPATVDDLLKLLSDHGAGFVGAVGSPRARPAVVAALRAAWR